MCIRDRTYRETDRHTSPVSMALLSSSAPEWINNFAMSCRQTDRQTDRHTDRQRDRHTDIHRRCRWLCCRALLLSGSTTLQCHVDRQTDRHTYRQTDRHTERHTSPVSMGLLSSSAPEWINNFAMSCRHTYIQTDRQTYIASVDGLAVELCSGVDQQLCNVM